jgi:zinc resistance-associated protein
MIRSARVLAFAVIISAIAPATVKAQDWGVHGSDRWEEQNYRFSTEDLKAFADVRIAGLKAGLQLTQEQQANWPPFEQALRDLATLRIERIRARGSGDQQEPSPDPFDRLEHRAEAMSAFAAALKRVADSGTPLFQSLTDGQKSRFVYLAHMLRWWDRDFGKEHREFGNYDHQRQHGMRSNEWNDSEENGMTSPSADEDDDDDSE